MKRKFFSEKIFTSYYGEALNKRPRSLKQQKAMKAKDKERESYGVCSSALQLHVTEISNVVGAFNLIQVLQ